MRFSLCCKGGKYPFPWPPRLLSVDILRPRRGGEKKGGEKKGEMCTEKEDVRQKKVESKEVK